MLAISVAIHFGYRGDEHNGDFTSESPSHGTCHTQSWEMFRQLLGMQVPPGQGPILLQQRLSFDFHSCSGLREDSYLIFPLGGEA